MPAFLGVPSHVFVFTSQILESVRTFPANFGYAASLAVVLMAIVLIGVVLSERATGSREKYGVITGRGLRATVVDLGSWKYLTLSVIIAYLSISTILPLFILTWASVMDFYAAPSLDAFSHLTLENYAEAISHPITIRSLYNSLILAFASATIVMLLTTIMSWLVLKSRILRVRVLSTMAFLSVMVPSVPLAIALIWFYLPLGLYGTIWILLIAYVTKFLSYGIRYSDAAVRQVNEELIFLRLVL